MISTVPKTKLFLGVFLMSFPAVAAGQGPGEADFARGLFLQTHRRDLGAAGSAFEKVIADQSAPEHLRVEAKQRLARCREDLAAADFARLMPPDALAYVEISRPGKHLARVAKMVGLVRARRSAPTQTKPKATPLGDGIFLPEDFTVSPFLLAALSEIEGAAFALTAIDSAGKPQGVLALHPGDSDLIRGLAETAVQFLEPADPIEGFRAYRIRDEACITVTNTVAGVIACSRSAGSTSPCLSTGRTVIRQP